MSILTFNPFGLFSYVRSEARQRIEVRYEQVEEALAEVMNITPKGIGAFRGRLRHLRNIGSPRLPKTGSGRAIDYSRQHALEMLLALELQRLGQTARRAALLAGSMVRQTPYGQFHGKDCFVCCQAHSKEYVTAFGLDVFMKMMESAPYTFLVINISACVRKLETALGNANSRS
jgi:hypothetical protein